jgi:hypothetical protein
VQALLLAATITGVLMAAALGGAALLATAPAPHRTP